VLLDEFLGEVVDENLVQLEAADIVIVQSSENSINTATGCDDSNVRAGATEVGDYDDLVRQLSIGTGVICQNCGNGLVDELEDLDAGLFCGLVQSLFLSIRKVCGDGDDSRVDRLAKVVRRRVS
jgi:hypothetical protein